MAKSTLIELEDWGQDLLELLVNESGEIIDAGPFHRDLYKGDKVLNIADIEEGDHVKCVSKEGQSYTFRYPVVNVKAVVGNNLAEVEEE